MDPLPTTLWPAPTDRESWRRAAALRDAKPAQVWAGDEIAVLREFNLCAGAGGRGLENIDRLADPQTLVVVAGQQAGLFLTPLYILYKAVAAVKWSRRLADLLGRPVVPAFWIASEDHDFDEIGRVNYLDKDGEAATWTYPAPMPGRSVFDVPMDKSLLDGFLGQLAAATHPTEFKDAVVARWRSHVAASQGFEDLFARGLMDLLGEHGLILISPRLAPMRRRAVPIVRREIENPGRSTGLVLQAARRLTETGRHSALHRRGDEANFFLYRDGLRCKVTIEGQRFLVHPPGSEAAASPLDAAGLLDELDRSPEDFSPNVVLRPLVQDHALPVLATVAGPGERQYLPQLRETYDFFGLVAPVILPRPRAVLVEPRIERQLSRLGVGADTIRREDWAAIQEAFLRSSDAGQGLNAVSELRESQAAALERARLGLERLASNPAVASALEKTGTTIQGALERFEWRVRDEIRRGQETAGRHLDRLFDALRPDKKPQERVLSPLAPFLFNYGPAFVPWLIDALDLDETSVQVLFLSGVRSGSASA